MSDAEQNDRERLLRYRKALMEIAAEDWRGNRPSSIRIAEEALHEEEPSTEVRERRLRDRYTDAVEEPKW